MTGANARKRLAFADKSREIIPSLGPLGFGQFQHWESLQVFALSIFTLLRARRL